MMAYKITTWKTEIFMLSIVAKIVLEICFIKELIHNVNLFIISEITVLKDESCTSSKTPEKYIKSVASGTTKRLVMSDKTGMLWK